MSSLENQPLSKKVVIEWTKISGGISYIFLGFLQINEFVCDKNGTVIPKKNKATAFIEQWS